MSNPNEQETGIEFEADVLRHELDAIERLRARREGAVLDAADDVEHSLFGIAFSGGGIRSATFNLGILQALAKQRLLGRADYLSTNSGGGYIGSWFSAWVRRTGSLAAVEQDLVRSAEVRASDVQQVTWLRRFSNYLTPRMGVFSGDTWMAVATYLRNFLLNLVTVCALICFALLLPHVILHHGLGSEMLVLLTWIGALVGGATFTYQVSQVAAQPDGRPGWLPDKWRRMPKGLLQIFLVVPLLLSAVCLVLQYRPHDTGLPYPLLWLGYVLLWWVAALIAVLAGQRERWRTWLALAACAVPAAGTAMLLSVWVPSLVDGAVSAEVMLVVGPPVIMLTALITGIVHLGLIGRMFRESQRQWWSRLGGWILGYSVAWLLFVGIAVLIPIYQDELRVQAGAMWAGVGGWLSTSVAGVLIGNQQGRESSRIRSIVVSVAPTVFILGLLVSLTLLLSNAVALERAGAVWSSMLGLGILALFLSWRVNINTFSLHHFYRSRLVRAYVGASDEQTKDRQHPFTGFDHDVDVPLSQLTPGEHHDGPLHLLNTALNLVGQQSLDWQERRAASFCFSPLYTGYSDETQATDAYQRTREIGTSRWLDGKRNGEIAKEPVTLGLAMGISGAAVSPNMGSQSSSSLAFLLTMFNVRLGWWFGNTRWAGSDISPTHGTRYLLSELFSLTSDRSKFVYLSDGGHFENMAVYELLRRRCRFILCTDCGADPDWKFEDLGNLIRKARVDFGAEIDIDVSPIRPKGGVSAAHCVVGDVRYDDGRSGFLLYVKPSLTGQEPQDVQQFATANATFPQQTTSDQWFSESQFESYRALGYHIGNTVFRNMTTSRGLEPLFVELKRAWYPGSLHTRDAFSRHGSALDSLFAQLRADADLQFLDEQFYPEWRALVNHGGPLEAVAAIPQLPSDEIELRKGFYFCSSLIQLMENVYLDLNLEWEAEHPDNTGWLSLFEHWTWSSMFNATWAISASTYGDRFRNFVERRFAVKSAKVTVEQTTSYLNFVERAEVEALSLSSEQVVWSVLVIVEMPGELEKPNQLFRYPCGYACVDKGQLLHMRIQSHLRNRGLAREALVCLLQSSSGLERLADRPNGAVPVADESVAQVQRLFDSALLEVRGTVADSVESARRLRGVAHPRER